MKNETKPDSFIMQRLMKDLKNRQLDQITAKAYLDLNVFGHLEQSLNHLLETIERNGEFSKYKEIAFEIGPNSTVVQILLFM